MNAMPHSEYTDADLGRIEAGIAQSKAERHADHVALIAYARASGAPNSTAAVALARAAERTLAASLRDAPWPSPRWPSFISCCAWIDAQ